MQTGAITGYIDVAQVALYAFWIFFAGLIYYLRSEDKREGYPLVSDRERVRVQGFPPIPRPKTFLLAHGGTQTAPREEPVPGDYNAVPLAAWPGAPIVPTGNPLLAGVGPGASVLRADVHDQTYDEELPRITPLRVASEFSVDPETIDPVGMTVYGADRAPAGTVTDVWIDLADVIARYLEVELSDGKHVLLPITLAKFELRDTIIVVRAITSAQFADVPALKNPDQVTLREEDQITAYYGAGKLFALPGRPEPIV
jgi:photosynthetic reaction center H subunit